MDVEQHRVRYARLISLLCLILLSLPAPGQAGIRAVDDAREMTNIVVIRLAQFYPGSYDEEPVRIRQGERLRLVNLEYPGEGAIHDLVHDVVWPKLPQFASDLIGPTEWSWVYGVENLRPGTYPFYCVAHQGTMNGRLVVEPRTRLVDELR